MGLSLATETPDSRSNTSNHGRRTRADRITSVVTCLVVLRSPAAGGRPRTFRVIWLALLTDELNSSINENYSFEHKKSNDYTFSYLLRQRLSAVCGSYGESALSVFLQYRPAGESGNDRHEESHVNLNTAGDRGSLTESPYMQNTPNLTFDERVERLEKIANVMRRNVVDMVYTAQSGHIGGSLSAADFVTALYFDLMNIDPEEPHWADRDRFILSKGHACPIWYSALALRGYFPVEELKTLRKNDSRLQGHPIATYLPGLDASAGSLGIGFAQAVGMAMEAKHMKKDYKVYAVLGDGEINEGIVWETALAAAKYKLDNLVAIVDINNLQLDGTLEEVMPTEPIDAKFRAFGFDVMTMNGHDMADVLMTLTKARNARAGKPTCVLAYTVKGKGVSFMEDQLDWHGKAPNDEQYKIACAELEGANV